MENNKTFEYNGAARSSSGTFVRRPPKYKKSIISKEAILKIIELYYQGRSVRAISKEIKVTLGENIAKTRVHNIIIRIAA